MNGCEDKIASIERWLDGELSGAESESLRVHMASCAGCSETRSALGEIAVDADGRALVRSAASGLHAFLARRTASCQ